VRAGEKRRNYFSWRFHVTKNEMWGPMPQNFIQFPPVGFSLFSINNKERKKKTVGCCGEKRWVSGDQTQFDQQGDKFLSPHCIWRLSLSLTRCISFPRFSSGFT
jgi:hypothetical protein